jgi:hypothetical protein
MMGSFSGISLYVDGPVNHSIYEGHPPQGLSEARQEQTDIVSPRMKFVVHKHVVQFRETKDQLFFRVSWRFWQLHGSGWQ